MPKIIKEIDEIFSVVLDPPRSGVDSKLLLLLNKTKNCDEIIYISCNTETLVRDLKILEEFDIVFVKPYDMFPQTKHIETVVKLIKRWVMNEFDVFKKFENEEDFKMCDLTSDDVDNLVKDEKKTSQKFKDKYFDFYDDIKWHTRKGPQDW